MREPAEPSGGGGAVCPRSKGDPPSSAPAIQSPHDPQARYRTRSGAAWTGYIVHLSESCEDDAAHLLTHVMTTTAAVHSAKCTAAIHRALAAKGLLPSEHLVDAAYIDAELLVRSREALEMGLVGPPRPTPTWQGKVEGGYTIDRFEVDWKQERVRLPAGEGVLSLAPPDRPRWHTLHLRDVPQGRLCRLPGAALVHAG